MKFQDLSTPAILIDAARLDINLRAMQAVCDRTGTELWPHIKTHKLVPLLRRQLELGAKGATCAKVGEAEAMLPSGVRRIFIAHSLIQKKLAPRLRALRENLDELILAVTSEAQFEMLEALLAEAGIDCPVLLAVDTGLGREGVRSKEAARTIAERIRQSHRMELAGLYTHEGHAYSTPPDQLDEFVTKIHRHLADYAEAIGGNVPLWPGCSVTASRMAGLPGVKAVRPGSYLFGDLSLGKTTRVMPLENVAATVLATVVDKPEPGLALIDAGSKVFSSDRTASGLHAQGLGNDALTVSRLNEEHGYIKGEEADKLTLGEPLRLIPAHICPVINLATRVHLLDGDEIAQTWTVDGRGRSD